jgi:hypothetical protein
LSRAQSRATLDRIGVALSMSCALHCLFTPLLVASVSLGLFGVALVLIGAGRFLAPEPAETPMVVAGGLSIALAHVVNARLCRLCTGCQAAAGANLPPGLSARRCSPRADPATPSRPALREHAASSTLRER